MELKKQTFLYFQAVLDATSAPEVSADMIVPDLFPDMARIVDSAGQACVKEALLRDDRLDLTGLARVGVLYQPEGEEGLRKLDIGIPFNHVFDGHFPSHSQVFSDVRLLEIETRAVNPRKVSVLCRLSIRAVVYAPEEMSAPSDVTEPCEVRRQSCTAYMPVAVNGKGFTVNEEVEIPASRPSVDEIIIARPRMEVTDVKTVGSKVVFKGAVMLNVTYLNSGEPVSAEHEFSISQIMEMDGLEDNAAVDLDLRVTGIEMDVANGLGGESRRIAVALHLEAQAVAYMERQIETVIDLYSTTENLRPLIEPLSLTELVERGVRRQQVREALEVDDDIHTIVDTRVTLGTVTRLESGEIGCEAFVGLLYVTDGGEFRSLTHKLAVPAGMETEGAMIEGRQTGEVTAAPSSGGIELRFSVDFAYIATKTTRVLTVGGVQQEDMLERPQRPSVVLRRCHSGEALWDVAKRYSTTIGELCLANGLEDCETVPDGRLLLIPKKR